MNICHERIIIPLQFYSYISRNIETCYSGEPLLLKIPNPSPLCGEQFILSQSPRLIFETRHETLYIHNQLLTTQSVVLLPWFTYIKTDIIYRANVHARSGWQHVTFVSELAGCENNVKDAFDDSLPTGLDHSSVYRISNVYLPRCV